MSLRHLYFFTTKDLGIVAEVCQLWKNVTSDDTLWKHYCNDEVKKLKSNSFKDKLKEARDRIQFILQNEKAEVDIYNDFCDEPRRHIFSEELINSLKDPQLDISEKLKKVKKYFDEVKAKNSCPLIHDVLYSIHNLDINNLGLEIMLKAGADPNITDERSYTPLMIAVRNENIEAINILLNYGADPSLQNEEGKQAIDLVEVCNYNGRIINKILTP